MEEEEEEEKAVIEDSEEEKDDINTLTSNRRRRLISRNEPEDFNSESSGGEREGIKVVNAQKYLDKNYPYDITKKKREQDERIKNIVESSIFDFGYSAYDDDDLDKVKERRKIKELYLPRIFEIPGLISDEVGLQLEGHLDLSDFVKLEKLEIIGKISSLDVSNCSRLEELNISNNQLTHLDIASFGLEKLNCSGNNLISLNLQNSRHLKNLDCSDNQLTNLDLSGCEDLEELDCENNQLTSLNFQNNQKLINIKVSKNNITGELIIFSHLVKFSAQKSIWEWE